MCGIDKYHLSKTNHLSLSVSYVHHFHLSLNLTKSLHLPQSGLEDQKKLLVHLYFQHIYNLQIVVIVFVPVVKTTIISLCYKASGAVLEPISDKRVVNAINGVYESTVLLARVLLYAVAFFVLSIAIVCSSTNMMRW